MSPPSELIVLGAGISGVTTAIVLQALGLQTEIVAEFIPLQASTQTERSSVASCYAMASAYPHHLAVPGLSSVSSESQAVFQQLSLLNAAGVRQIRMYEVFEHQPEPAPLSDQRLGFELFDGRPQQLHSTVDAPMRREAEYIWGWRFKTFFADMPRYLQYLWSVYRAHGGTIHQQKLDRAGLEQLTSSGKLLVNCLGIGALALMPEAAPYVVMRGRQLMVPNGKEIKDPDGLPVAYNYTPPASVFTRGDGSAEYVHFFSRCDGWILGQTREPGALDSEGGWSGASVSGPELMIDGVSVPKPILRLNQQLLKVWKGVDVPDGAWKGRVGYRYYRDPLAHGVRLESEERDGTVFVHNYGHGGSGVTMSWGCSLAVARIVRRYVNLENCRTKQNDPLDELIARLALQS